MKYGQKIISSIILLALCATLLSCPTAAAGQAYTLHAVVDLGVGGLVGGFSGYWYLQQNTSIEYQYWGQVSSAVQSWNSVGSNPLISFSYTSTPYNTSPKLRFLVDNYGAAFRGQTIYYDSTGHALSEIAKDSGPDGPWDYCIIRLNNSKIEQDVFAYISESNYTKDKGVKSTAAHEIGHALGLSHHDSHSVLMQSDLENRLIRDNITSPQAGDIAGAVDAASRSNTNINEASSALREISDVNTPAYSKHSLEEFIQSYSSMSIGTFKNYGKIIGMGGGIINLCGHILDDTAYYVECIFETDAGQEIRALEYIGFGEQKNMNNVLPKNGKYALFLSESQGCSYIVDPELSLQHIVNDEIVWNPAAQAAIELTSNRMDMTAVLDLFTH